MNSFDFNNFWFLTLLAMWELIWKGLALWQAARREDKYWFAAILFINSAGLLPILYLILRNRPTKSLRFHSL